jgi:TPP-dependent pyruvate/acetoin dehydrogenase alpha subunit
LNLLLIFDLLTPYILNCFSESILIKELPENELQPKTRIFFTRYVYIYNRIIQNLVYTLKMKQLNYIKIIKNLFLIRNTEELIASEYKFNKFRCPVHLSIGQEGISAPINLVFSNQDLVVSSHRAHAHYIGKGCSIERLLAEILGLAGCSGGIGGSMHLTDKSKGFICSTAIVGNSIPIGVGLSLSQKFEKSNNITLIFFGEGATEQGVFYESLNFAALKELPSLFVCEDNKFSVYSSLKDRQPKKRNIVKFVKNMGVEAIEVNGNYVLDVIKAYKKAKNYILKNKKPFFIKFNTFRYLEHCGPNNDDYLGYRSKKDILYWKKKCPINLYKSFLIKNKILKKNNIETIENEIKKKIKDSYMKAQKYSKPRYSELKKLIFYEKKNKI